MDSQAQDIFFSNVEALRRKAGMSQAEVAHAIGVRPTHLNAVWCGRKRLSAKMSEQLSKYFATDLSVLYSKPNGIPSTSGESVEYVSVPLVAYGQGVAGDRKQLKARVIAFFGFKQDWLHSKGNSDNMAVVAVRGDQTGGLLPDGALVLIDESQTSLIDGKLYLIGSTDGICIAKHIESSETADIRVALERNKELRVMGKAIWYGLEL